MLIDNTGEKIIDAAAQAGTASSVQNFWTIGLIREQALKSF
jgi:hypothetical protein